MSKNVLIVSEIFPPIIKGGAASSVYSLVTSLAESGQNISILTAKSKDELQNIGFSIYRVDIREYYFYSEKGLPQTLSKLISLIHNIKVFRKEIKHIVKRQKVNIIHTQLFASTVAAANLRKKLKIPVVATIRGYWTECFFIEKWNDDNNKPCEGCSFKRLYNCLRKNNKRFNLILFFNTIIIYTFMYWVRKQLKNVDCFLPISEHFKNMLIKRNMESIYIVPNIFEDSYYKKYFTKKKDNIFSDNDEELKGIKANKKIALYMGRVRKAKGVSLIIENAINFPDIVFLIVGDKDHIDFLKNLEKIIIDNNLKNIIFIDWIPYSVIKKYYELADIVILPFLREEPLSRSMLEALCFGKPILASNIGGNPDGVIDGVNGVLFTPGKEGFKEGMRRIMNMDFEKMGKESMKIFNEKFNKGLLIQKYLDVYDKVIDNTK